MRRKVCENSACFLIHEPSSQRENTKALTLLQNQELILKSLLNLSASARTRRMINVRRIVAGKFYVENFIFSALEEFYDFQNSSFQEKKNHCKHSWFTYSMRIQWCQLGGWSHFVDFGRFNYLFLRFCRSENGIFYEIISSLRSDKFLIFFDFSQWHRLVWISIETEVDERLTFLKHVNAFENFIVNSCWSIAWI